MEMEMEMLVAPIEIVCFSSSRIGWIFISQKRGSANYRIFDSDLYRFRVVGKASVD